MKTFLMFTVVCFICLAGAIGYADRCESSSRELPPPCPYSNETAVSVEVRDSLENPVGTLEFRLTLNSPDPATVTRQHCDNVLCGCEIVTFQSLAGLDITGTGQLAGYQRNIQQLPVSCEIHTFPPSPVAPTQTIETEMVRFNFLVPNDPDFDLLDIAAGRNNSLQPSTGQTTLEKLPNGNWQVDSFFDITYRIDFIGAPGSPLENLHGTLAASDPIQTSTPAQTQPHFLLASEEDWQKALNSGEVRPMRHDEGILYLDMFNANLQEGDPYPPTTYLEPQLYVMGEGEYSDEPGLVMEWGNPSLPDDEYAAAWMYVYPLDPDLTNTTVSVTVDPPCGMNVVSLGMQDVNGNIRAWYWNVAAAGAVPPYPAGTIPCNSGPGMTTTVSINTALTGVGAATPAAASYSSAPGFDITQVVSFSFDENNNFIASVQAPSPGSGLVANWNYWHTLLVTPNIGGGGGGGGGTSVDSKWFVKYSQPPEEIVTADGNTYINGWDEYSSYRTPPMMADDWECKDERPVTDIHWWGSFIGWTQPYPPPQMPVAFHIGIWTDVPDPNPTDPVDWSHPGTLVWENYCTSFIWNFAGYDLDPRFGEPMQQEDEACFQFAQFLDQDEWFHQKPMEDGTPNVYWLSIAAVYKDPNTVQHPWGWKTRPHFFNDDAVRIAATPQGTWPPAIGSTLTMSNCTPVEWPQGTSWDLAFELTTNEPAYQDNPIPGDIAGPLGAGPDGSVNLNDLVALAENWLTSVSP